jgi:phage terminase large subunit-like protein
MASGTLASALATLSERELEFLFHDWQVWARDDQLVEFATDKRVVLMLGGRGSGKTRAGAEWVRALASEPSLKQRTATASETRIALVGNTMHDVRSVMVEGVSGILAVHPACERPVYEPSKRRITWANGTVAELFSADEAESLRGPQFSHAWCDEFAKWRDAATAWDMLQFALRLGDDPKVAITTTPRVGSFLKKIMADEATVTVTLSTADNALNLAPTFLAEMTRRYAGSALGRQELLGEIVEDVSDSLWRRQWIDDARVMAAPEMRRVIVALDPPVTATAHSDACGIVVAGLGVDGRAYVLADRTIQGRTPDVWAKAAIAAYDDFAADRVVAEINQGGDLVIGVIHQFAKNLPVVKVRATRGKWVRAEPVAALYAEGRVAHVGRFDALEDQLAAFGVDGTVRGKSPDRADALVWAITELLLSDGVQPNVRML